MRGGREQHLSQPGCHVRALTAQGAGKNLYRSIGRIYIADLDHIYILYNITYI